MKMYKIYFSGILCYGYVTVRMMGKSGKTDLPATKFKLKWVADLCCWLLNKGDQEFKTYKVVKI